MKAGFVRGLLMKARPWILALAVGLVIVTAAVLVHRSRTLISTDAAFVEGTMTYLAARVGGQVLEVRVVEHQRVKKGDVLVVLDPADYQARVDRARADLAAAENRMAAVRAAVAAAEAEHRATVADLWSATREYERVEALVKRNASSQQDLDRITAQRDALQARAQALALQADAARAELGNEAPVLQARSSLATAELELAHTRVVAPFDGVIGRKNVEPGAIASPGQPLVSITGDDQSWVMANFKETQVRRLRVGHPAEIHIDAFPDVVWRGHVDSFSPATGAQYAFIPPDPASGNFIKVVQRLPVKIALDRAEGAGAERVPSPLPVGLSAEVTVDVR